MPPESTDQSVDTDAKSLQQLYDLGDEAGESVVMVQSDPVVKQLQRPRDPETGQFVPTHNKFLVQAAKQLDISDDELDDLDPKELRQYIDDARRAQTTARKEATIEGALEDGQRRAAAARAERFEQEKLQKEEAIKADADPLAGIKEEEYTPEYRNVFTLLRTLHKEVKELKAFKTQAETHLVAQANESTASFARKVDQQLALLGPDYEPFIGRGRGMKLPQNSLERAVRGQLIQDAAAMAGEGATREDIVENIQLAAQKRFGRLVGDAPKQPRKPSRSAHPQFRVAKQQTEETNGELLTDEQIAWMNSGVRRPSQRNGAAEPKGREKAINAVAQRQQEWRTSGGGYDEGYETTEDDFLP